MTYQLPKIDISAAIDGVVSIMKASGDHEKIMWSHFRRFKLERTILGVRATIIASPTKLILDTGLFLQIHLVYIVPDLQEATHVHNTPGVLHGFQILRVQAHL